MNYLNKKNKKKIIKFDAYFTIIQVWSEKSFQIFQKFVETTTKKKKKRKNKKNCFLQSTNKRTSSINVDVIVCKE